MTSQQLPSHWPMLYCPHLITGQHVESEKLSHFQRKCTHICNILLWFPHFSSNIKAPAIRPAMKEHTCLLDQEVCIQSLLQQLLATWSKISKKILFYSIGESLFVLNIVLDSENGNINIDLIMYIHIFLVIKDDN